MAGGGLGVAPGGIWWSDGGCTVAEKELGGAALLLGMRYEREREREREEECVCDCFTWLRIKGRSLG